MEQGESLLVPVEACDGISLVPGSYTMHLFIGSTSERVSVTVSMAADRCHIQPDREWPEHLVRMHMVAMAWVGPELMALFQE